MRSSANAIARKKKEKKERKSQGNQTSRTAYRDATRKREQVRSDKIRPCFCNLHKKKSEKGKKNLKEKSLQSSKLATRFVFCFFAFEFVIFSLENQPARRRARRRAKRKRIITGARMTNIVIGTTYQVCRISQNW